ncbi:hypothetical protein AJ80_10052 [Polytolypa hystricis UAMH7299]|uniref:Uncharacterized protein n=1 Tax=Polytolypa hystricis (strain UAMH7299) TaxID=1447883 RepID=A0A2B7W669_POLH7|nr:hypothetical protein AJ80_10052 [Polytolypa hystricis UAMH7299]
MLQHDDVELPDQNVGGRLTLKEQQEAVRFYRSVIEGNVEDDDDDSDDASCSPSVPVEKPKLPMQQNGKKDRLILKPDRPADDDHDAYFAEAELEIYKRFKQLQGILVEEDPSEIIFPKGVHSTG